MALKIKICGLNTHDAVDAAIAAGADMLGFVLHPKSPRYVSLPLAAELAARARGKAETVALTVDATLAELESIGRTMRPDWHQLHGKESLNAVSAIRQRHDLAPVIKAIGVETAADLGTVRAYDGCVAMILLDAKPPKDAAYPGGHGKPFDWSILTAVDPWRKILLAGGLTPDNVGDAIRAVRGLGERGPKLFGVDVSSGVESAPGVKDIDKIVRFIAEARAADVAAPNPLTKQQVDSVREKWRR
jgi:phosphoribosylanthranilate isomerase